jgi:hypothetical protein
MRDEELNDTDDADKKGDGGRDFAAHIETQSLRAGGRNLNSPYQQER